MKNRFEISLVVVIGFSMLAITIHLLNNQDFLQDFTTDSYPHLVTRDAKAVISKSAKFMPERTCFEIGNDHDSLVDYPEGFRKSLDEASRVSEDKRYDPDYFVGFQYPGNYFEMSAVEAIKYIGQYEFEEKVLDFAVAERQAGFDTTEGYPEIATSQIRYNCFFTYDDTQYLLQIIFYPMVPYMGNFTQVDIVEQKKPDGTVQTVMTKPDIAVYRVFNGTVVFNNKLDSSVTFKFVVPPKNDYRFTNNDVSIPPGMSLTYYFDQYYIGGKVPYHYFVLPQGMKGSVLVKEAPDCMSEIETKSLYSQVARELKFPQYLPENYEFQCGHFVTTGEVYVGYDDTGMLHDNIEMLSHYKYRQQYYDQGGIILDYYFMKDAKRDCTLNDVDVLTLGADNYATVVYGKINENDSRWNFLRVCTDSEVYNIKGLISRSEMIKIAESIH